jgi:predicted DNA-binding protein
MKRTNINLHDAQYDKLKARSAKTGATMSALIRKAVDAYLGRSKGK